MHSMIFGVRHFYINDKPVGELGLNAYLAGFYDVPVIMAAGDDCAAKEAEELIRISSSASFAAQSSPAAMMTGTS